MAHTYEYLSAFLDRAKEILPRYTLDQIRNAAIPSSGGSAGRRVPQHSPLEETALRKMSPDMLDEASDDELMGHWKQLSEAFRLATKKKLDTDRYTRAASFVAQEIMARNIPFDNESDLGRAAVAKSTIGARLELLPSEIVIGSGASLDRFGDGLRFCCGPDPIREHIERSVRSCGIPGLVIEADGDDDAIPLYDVVLRRVGVHRVEAEEPARLQIVHDRRHLLKSAPELGVIWYVVAEPDTPDTYGDVITRDEIMQAWLKSAGNLSVKMEHGHFAGLNADGGWPQLLDGMASVVGSIVVPQTITSFWGKEVAPVTEGSWMAAVYYDDESLREFLFNTEHGISLAGDAVRSV